MIKEKQPKTKPFAWGLHVEHCRTKEKKANLRNSEKTYFWKTSSIKQLMKLSCLQKKKYKITQPLLLSKRVK